MPNGQPPAVRDDYGVLTAPRLRNWIGSLAAVSLAVSVLVGFVGAPHAVSFHHFAWSLAAVAGTAIGTVSAAPMI